MLIAAHTTRAGLTASPFKTSQRFHPYRPMRCNGTQSRAFLCSWVKDGEEIRCLLGEIALADGEKSVESGPYLERAEKTRDGHSHLSKHHVTQSRVSTANSLFILLICPIIRRVFETCGCFVFICGFSLWILYVCHALLPVAWSDIENQWYVRVSLIRWLREKREHKHDTLPTVQHVKSRDTLKIKLFSRN